MPKGSHHSSKTHCVNGHEFTPENTRIARTNGGSSRTRQCRVCQRAAQKRAVVRTEHGMVRWRKLNQAKWKKRHAAQDAVKYAVRIGKLQKPTKCSACGKEKKLYGHHHKGYAKANRLNVVWLCSVCHGEQHRKASHEIEQIGSLPNVR